MMKRLLMIMGLTFSLCGCLNTGSLSLQERLAREYYKETEEGYVKEMVGVSYRISKQGVFTISNKGSYDVIESEIQVGACAVDAATMEAAEGSSCSDLELDKASQIKEAFSHELQRLNVSESELFTYLMQDHKG